jgi:hypothetical protein
MRLSSFKRLTLSASAGWENDKAVKTRPSDANRESSMGGMAQLLLVLLAVLGSNFDS